MMHQAARRLQQDETESTHAIPFVSTIYNRPQSRSPLARDVAKTRAGLGAPGNPEKMYAQPGA